MVPVSLVTLLAVATPHALRATRMLRHTTALETTSDNNLVYVYANGDCSEEGTAAESPFHCVQFSGGGSGLVDFEASCTDTEEVVIMKHFSSSTNCTGTSEPVTISPGNCAAVGDNLSIKLVLPSSLSNESVCTLVEQYAALASIEAALANTSVALVYGTDDCTGTGVHAGPDGSVSSTVEPASDTCDSNCCIVENGNGTYETLLVTCSDETIVYGRLEYPNSTCKEPTVTQAFALNSCMNLSLFNATVSMRLEFPSSVTKALCNLIDFQTKYSVNYANVAVTPEQMLEMVPASAAYLKQSTDSGSAGSGNAGSGSSNSDVDLGSTVSRGAVPLLLLLAVIQALLL